MEEWWEEGVPRRRSLFCVLWWASVLNGGGGQKIDDEKFTMSSRPMDPPHPKQEESRSRRPQPHRFRKISEFCCGPEEEAPCASKLGPGTNQGFVHHLHTLDILRLFVAPSWAFLLWIQKVFKDDLTGAD